MDTSSKPVVNAKASKPISAKPSPEQIKKPVVNAKASKPISAKPSPEQIKKAVEKPAKMIQAFSLEAASKNPYAILQPNRKAFSAWTISALIVSAKLELSAKGIAKAIGVGNGLYALLTSSTMRSHWGDATGRIDASGKLTVKGLAEIQARLSGQSRGYDTDMETVNKFVHAMRNGGTVDVGAHKFRVNSAVSAKA